MPAPILSRDEVVERLSRVFRRCGYDGATLARLSETTGLGRASLYHHFPGGKEGMARAVLQSATDWLREKVLEPLRGPGDPADRLHRMTRSLNVLYASGSEACLLGVLAGGDARDLFQDPIRDALKAWTEAIAAVLVEAGLPPDEAAERAEDAVIRIQGALVVARGLGTTAPFVRTLRRLPDDLLAPPPPPPRR